MLSLIRPGDLRVYLAGQAASVFGSSLTGTATSVIAVIGLHATPREVSLIVVSATLPSLLFGPMCGVLADRIARPRRVILITDLFSAGVVLACAVAALTGLLTMVWLYGLSFLIGIAQIILLALYLTHLRSLDGVEDLGAARGFLQTSDMISRAAAAAIAGPLVAVLGVPLLFLLDAFSYGVSAACLRVLRSPDLRRHKPGPRTGILREMRAGISAIRAHHLLSAYAVYIFFMSIAASGTMAQRAVFLLDTLQLPVALYSAPMMVATILGAAGSLLAPRLLSRGMTARRLLLLCSLAGAVTALALPAAAGPLWAVVALITVGLAFPVFFGAAGNLALVTLLSDDIGDEFFGRTTTMFTSIATLATTIGALIGGIIGEQFGVRIGILLCQGIAIFAVTILLVWVRRSRHRSPQGPAVLAS